MRGSAFNDTLTGSDNASGVETFEGREGNDSINGGGGTDQADYYYAKAGVTVNLATGIASDGLGGTDTLVNIEDVRGSRDFNDSITGSALANTLEGKGGNDTLNGGAGNDTILGGDGDDNITGGDGDDSIVGGDEADPMMPWAGDTIDGGTGNDTILGGAGNDYIDGGAGNDSALGGDGNDNFNTFYGGNDTLRGEAGNDTFSVGGTYVPGAPADSVVVDGGSGDDVVRLYGGPTGFAVTATGGTGIDTYELYNSGGTAFTVTDFVAGAGGDRIDVANLINSASGLSGGNPFNPALGYLRLVQSDSSTLLQFDQDGVAGTMQSWATVLTLQNITAATLTADNFVGGYPPDGSTPPGLVLTGTAESDTLVGGAGNDTIDGLAGGDSITGGGGDDLIFGGDEADPMFPFGDFIDGGTGNDTILGGAGNDYIDGGAGNDSALGGDGNDNFNTFYGGNDTLRGEAGNDTFSVGGTYVPGAPADSVVVNGGSGDDVVRLYGGPTGFAVTATGGTGIDTYELYNSGGTTFTVTDFVAGGGGDQIDVVPLLGSWSLSQGFSAGNPFNPALGYLRLVQSGANTLLQFDPDGVAGTFQSSTVLTLQNVTAAMLTADNFVGGLPPDGSTPPGLVLTGTAGWDTLVGGAGNDTIDGLAGSDSITGGFGNDSIDGGDEADPMMPWAGDTIDGGSGNDTILGGAGNDLVQGGVGNDSLAGESGNDQLQGGLGNDTLLGGDGDDSISGGGGLDLVDGGAGTDTLSLNGMLADYRVSRPSGTQIVLTNDWSGDSLSASNVENFQFFDGVRTLADFPVISATPYADSLVGTAGNDWIDGLAGNDTLTGLAGNDALIGGTGIDSLIGGLGDDVYGVDVAGDVIVELNGEGTDQVNVAFTAAGTYTLSANVENATITTATAGVNLTGNGENNALTGNGTANILTGGAGNDTLVGGAGNDTLVGGAGNDNYVIDVTTDVVTENADEGTDQVNVALAAAGTYTVAANVEYGTNWQCHGRRQPHRQRPEQFPRRQRHGQHPEWRCRQRRLVRQRRQRHPARRRRVRLPQGW